MIGCRPLTSEEVAALLNASAAVLTDKSSARLAAQVVLMCCAGLRAAECLALTVGKVKQHGAIVTELYLERRTTKGKTRGRRLYLSERCRAALAEWLAYSGLDGAPASTTLWPVSIGGSAKRTRYNFARCMTYGAMMRALRVVVTAAGLQGKVRSHSFRKTFAKHVYKATGNNPLCVQEALGHARIDQTIAYLDADADALKAAMLSA